MTKIKSCRTCKHFRGNRWVWNLWGLIKNDDYYEYAECDLGRPDGSFAFCSTQRLYDWSEDIAFCDRSGRAWEAKEK